LIALPNILAEGLEGVVRAGRAVRAVTFGYLVRLVFVRDEGVVRAGGGIQLEVSSRRTRKVTFRVGVVLNHLAHEPTIIDFFLEIPPAKPPFFQHIPFPPRTTKSVRRSDTLGSADLPPPTHRSNKILVAVLFAAGRFGTLFF
jgi:hypothetical protein